MDKLTIFNYPLYWTFGYMLKKWKPRPSALFCKRYLEFKKDLVICEIGSDKGENANDLIKLLNPKEIYLIEPFTNPKVNGKHTLIKKKSENAVKDIPMCDYIYIDGDHRYSEVKKDIENYWNKVEDGGLLAGHDFATNETGVIQAVTEFAVKNNLKLNVLNTDWWILK